MYRKLRQNPCKLTPEWRWRVRCWLADKTVLRELYAVKEAINRLYRMRGWIPLDFRPRVRRDLSRRSGRLERVERSDEVQRFRERSEFRSGGLSSCGSTVRRASARGRCARGGLADRVCDSRVSQGFVPSFRRHLSGDHGLGLICRNGLRRLRAGRSLDIVHRIEEKVVEHQHVDSGELPEE